MEQRDADGSQWTWRGDGAWRLRIARRNSWGQLFYSGARDCRAPIGAGGRAASAGGGVRHRERKSG